MLIAVAVLGFLTAIAVVPIHTRPLPSSPHPIAEYAAAVAAYDTVQQREQGLVMPDGASLMYVHGQKTPRVIVLVHGLTNSPRQFRDLGQIFYDRGYNVIVPRLPQHGLVQADVGLLKSLTAEKYRDYADRAVDIADGLGDSVFVLGLSAGGDVAAWIAENRPEVKRIVVIAPALRLARLPSLLDAPAMNFMSRIPNITIHQQGDSTRKHAYFGVSTRALGHMLQFGQSIINDAEHHPPVVSQIVLVTNGNDHTIDGGAAEELTQLWQAHDSTLSLKTYQFPTRLGLPHDVIDVTQHCGLPQVVYPVMIALIENRVPDPIPDSVEARCPVHQPERGE